MLTTIGVIALTTLLTFVPALELFRTRKWLDLTLVLVLGLFLMLLQTFKDTQESSIQEAKDKKIDTLKTELRIANERCSTANYLSQLNYQLSQKIETLSNLNISIDSSTQLIVSNSNNLVSENIHLTEAIPPLTENVKKLVKTLGDEVTGGISVPLLSASLILDSIPKNFHSYDAAMTGKRFPTGKWILTLTLKNTGPNKLTDISLGKFRRGKRDRGQIEEKLNCADVLLPYDSVNVEVIEVSEVLPQLENGELPYYWLTDSNGENLFFTVKVKWRNAFYSFNCILKHGYVITLATSYEFAGRNYNDSSSFLNSIKEYLRARE